LRLRFEPVKGGA